ncbi:MAG: DNA photolyase family protein [Cyclobacteriaceae bacterium]|nr:DNA photolyase family protein [Cyclobacteriaceae bacterium]
MDNNVVIDKNWVLFWFRRDLRLPDNTGLQYALASGKKVLPVFIFDTHILNDLPPSDRRVSYIYDLLLNLNTQLRTFGSSLLIHYGTPESFFSEIKVGEVYANRDYEPYALHRDNLVENILKSNGIPFFTYKDHLIFEQKEVIKKNGDPYTVFTPFSKIWKQKLTENVLTEHKIDTRQFAQVSGYKFPSLEQLGFKRNHYELPELKIQETYLTHYEKNRDFPSLNNTTNLGVRLRFGSISIRKAVKTALENNEKLLNELIWREFYSMILWNFPHIENSNFRSDYDLIPWRNDPEELDKWKNGLTGYSFVDAGMRELKATGFMNNRARMICAGFLTKHLLTHWSFGEAWFASNLMDFDMASNNGNWQWAAGTGCDASPYFRVFNPVTQQKKFDPEFKYIRKWIPEFGTPEYPAPIVDHVFARERAIQIYKRNKKQ